MESLKELNKICQKPNYKTVGNWMVRNIVRDAALPITWLLLHTPVTANQVTIAAILIGLLGVFFLGVGGTGAFVLGVLLLQLWYLLDHVDGQVARYRKTASLTGRFFDFVMHHLIHPIVFFAMGYYFAVTNTSHFWTLVGFSVCMCMMFFNLIHDIKYKTWFERASKLKGVDFVEFTSKEGEQASDANQNSKKIGKRKRLYSLLHKLCEMHVLMNILTLGAFLQLLTPSMDYRGNLFLVYTFVVPFVTLTKYAYLILKKKIDEEYKTTILEK